MYIFDILAITAGTVTAHMRRIPSAHAAHTLGGKSCILPLRSSEASYGPFSPGVQVLLPWLRPEPPCGTRGCQARGRSAWAADARSVDVLGREHWAAVDRQLKAEDAAGASVWAAASESPPSHSSGCATFAWAATAAAGRNCSGRQLGAGGRSHGGRQAFAGFQAISGLQGPAWLQALAGFQANDGKGGKGHGVTVYGRVASLADWEPSAKGDGLGEGNFFVSTADELRRPR